jgi:triphosphoribosyl-dephospho-CoA synthase
MTTLSRRLSRGRAAFLWACSLDVAVRKPGNVSHASAGHGMEAEAFLASARAAAGPLFARGQPVGARIEAAVAATRAAVGCNTNLGILLLCAPLAAALERLPGNAPAALERLPDNAPAQRPPDNKPPVSRLSAPPPPDHCTAFDGAAGGDPATLRAAVRTVLADLDVDDARAAYRAIALANPGGLGRAEAEDVAAPPSVDLRTAMGLAAERDSIARQYANGYADVFGYGLAALTDLGGRGGLAGAVQTVFLCFLAGWPDSHIVRKLGGAVAQTVTADAARWLARLRSDPAAGERADFAAWDDRLKAAGINPGTSADLTVCTLFAAALARPAVIGMAAAESWHGSCIHPIGIGPFPTSDMRASLLSGRSR